MVIGYGHETAYPHHCSVSISANVIERHVTLDRSMWGSDQSAFLSRLDYLN